MIAACHKQSILQAMKDFTSMWDCKGLGELKKYVGCKVDRTEQIIRFTQPMKIQRFVDKFGCKGADTGDKAPTTPAPPGTMLEVNKDLEEPLLGKKKTQYRSGVGILLCMVRYSRPDTLNRVRKLSRFMQGASRECYKALIQVMSFIVATRELEFIF